MVGNQGKRKDLTASLNACLGQACPVPSSEDSEDGSTHSLAQKFLLSPLYFLLFLFLFHLSPTTCARCALCSEPQRPSRCHSAVPFASYLPSPRAGSCLFYLWGWCVHAKPPGLVLYCSHFPLFSFLFSAHLSPPSLLVCLSLAGFA